MADKITTLSLSELAVALEEARSITIKRYMDYRKAKELEDTLRFQLHSDLIRYGQDNKKEEK